jgi:hypothetical protein
MTEDKAQQSKSQGESATQDAVSTCATDNENSQNTAPSSPQPTESYLPVSHLTSDILQQTFQDLSQATPSSLCFGSAICTIGNDPIQALFYALDDFGFPIFTSGERNNILRFTQTPLSHGLRITSSNPGTVYLLTAHEEKVYPLTSIPELKTVLLAILDTWRTLLLPSGSLRPRPLDSAILLTALEDETYTAVTPSFTECQRAVTRTCLLDACIELLTPFGFQPSLSLTPKQDICVRFAHPAFQKLEITRFDTYVTDRRLNGGGVLDMYKAAVIVTGLTTADEATAEADRVRRVSMAAIHAGLADEYGRGLFPKYGLVFSFALAADWKVLAERLVEFRREEREKEREERKREEERWLGKQCQFYEDWEREPGRMKRSELSKGRSSLLKCEVRPEDVVEREEGDEGDEECAERDREGGCAIDNDETGAEGEENAAEEDTNSEGGFEEYEDDRWIDAVDSGIEITEDEGEELEKANVPDLGTGTTDEMKQGELAEWLDLIRGP